MVNAAVGEKGAQGMRPYLMIDVVTNSSPTRWAMEAEEEPYRHIGILVDCLCCGWKFYLLSISITLN